MMTIKIGVGTLFENTREKYHNLLTEVLGDRYDVKSYNFNNYRYQKLDVDVLLVSTPVLVNIVRQFLSCDTRMILMGRTLTKESYDILRKIPPKTKALLVNNCADVTFETISIIYSFGFDFDLIPYNAIEFVDKGIDTVITPNELHLVPPGIKNVINMGNMAFDMGTMIELINCLDLSEDEKWEILKKYESKIVVNRTGINTLFSSNSTMKYQMQTILDLINDGVIETNTEDIITLVNKKAQVILNVNEEDITNKKVVEVFGNIDIGKQYDIEDKIIDYRGQKLIVNSRPVKVFNQQIGRIITFKNITELIKLQEQIKQEIKKSGNIAKYTIEDIKGVSKSILETKRMALKMADSDASVHIVGESGTGKELFAQAIHNSSTRKKFPFVAINCATLPQNLIESELFGYEGGAFTGALKDGKPGLFELAHNGTLFLDEIGDISLETQARLLRVLQEQEVVRIGSSKIRKVNVRILSATNKNLNELSRQGKFRWDLYYRLNVFPLRVPSLRERNEDIQELFYEFMKNLNCKKSVSTEVMTILYRHNWPGNVRELRNLAEYLAKMGEDPIIPENLPYLFGEECSIQYTAETSDAAETSALKKEVLKIIKTKADIREKVGRRTLMELIELKGYVLTEKEIRNLLEEMNQNGLVSIGRGRQGTSITDKGRKIVEAR